MSTFSGYSVESSLSVRLLLIGLEPIMDSSEPPQSIYLGPELPLQQWAEELAMMSV